MIVMTNWVDTDKGDKEFNAHLNRKLCFLTRGIRLLYL